MEQRGQYLTVVNGGGAAPPATAPEDLVIMPVLNARAFLDRRRALYDMLREEAMVEGVDYMTIPGTPKPSLLKPGAEKLLQLFGMRAELVPVEEIEQFDGPEPFLYYKYRADIYKGQTLIFSYTGIAHSKETKYRYRWVPEHEVPRYLNRAELEVRVGRASEYRFAVDKAETVGKYGKPAEYWQSFKDAIASGRAKSFKKPMGAKEMDAWEIDVTVYRIPNPDVPDLAHTLSAMAQKRAVVGSTRYATNASDVFEVKDLVDDGELDIIDGSYSYITEQEKAEEQERLKRAMNGSGKKYDQSHDHTQDIDDVFGGGAKNGNGNGKKLAPADEIRKRFGEATTGKDVPPSDAGFKAMLARLKDVGVDADRLATFLFNTPPGGLSEAHVKAITDSGDDQLKKVLA